MRLQRWALSLVIGVWMVREAKNGRSEEVMCELLNIHRIIFPLFYTPFIIITEIQFHSKKIASQTIQWKYDSIVYLYNGIIFPSKGYFWNFIKFYPLGSVNSNIGTGNRSSHYKLLKKPNRQNDKQAQIFKPKGPEQNSYGFVKKDVIVVLLKSVWPGKKPNNKQIS